MAAEKQKMSYGQIACFAVGIFFGLIFTRLVLGMDGVLGGALGGGLGAALGMGVYKLLTRGK